MRLARQDFARLAPLASGLLLVIWMIVGCGKSESADSDAKGKTNSVQTAVKTNLVQNGQSNSPAVFDSKSAFDERVKNGKDPFFPTSTRLQPRLVPTNGIASRPAAAAPVLTLKGISGPTDRRLALINNQVFAAGEEANVRVAAGSIKVRCLEITEHTAKVRIEGESEIKELRLSGGY
jgi:hypothetical protein